MAHTIDGEIAGTPRIPAYPRTARDMRARCRERLCLRVLGHVSEDAGRRCVLAGTGFGDHDDLGAICAVGDRTLWAAGADSTILKTNDGGNRWMSQVAPVAADYNYVSAWNVDLAWAVGQHGTIIHTANGGDSWETQPVGTTKDLLNVNAASENIVWAGGSNILLKTQDRGAAWKQVTNVTIKGDLQTEAVDPLTAWVCGSGGTVAKTVDGGAAWQSRP